MRLPKWLRNFPLLGNYFGINEEELDLLKRDFRSRYNAFKSLVLENQKSLNLITEMENALISEGPFDMSFVRSRCTAVTDCVLTIIDNLDKIAPGKYKTLYDRHDNITSTIASYIHTDSYTENAPLFLPLEELDRSLSEQTGFKMATLGELGNKLDIRIPFGFVVTTKAYREFIRHNKIQPEIDRLIQASKKDNIEQLYDLSEGIRQFIIGCPLPSALKEIFDHQYSLLEKEYGDNVPVAVRSSALGEDSPNMSFAGQYRTVLGANKRNISLAYKEVVASKYQVQAMTYRLNRGIRDEDVAMCVGCMPLINSKSGGVAYSGNPLDKSDKNIFILSVWGHPKPVVDGRTATDLFVVSRNEPLKIVQRDIPEKQNEYLFDNDKGLHEADLFGDKRKMASLSDEMVTKVARLVLKIEEHFRSAQDIEWLVDFNDEIHILQSRPLKQNTVQHIHTSSQPADINNDSVFFSGGITASPGVAAGHVFIVKNKDDALNFPDNAVLVTSQALPYWAMLLGKAAAVVTEQGSIAGHLANVAREFNIPAIFGIEQVTKKLSNDSLITVDADKKTIYEGKMDILLKRSPKKEKPPVKSNPTYQALKSAAEHIVPLRMLDPDSSDFRPGNCSTLHDITRFCHEKSVAELFETGIDHRLKTYGSKQLFCEFPMQYWIIDLENGFKTERTNDSYIKLEDIVSIPMLALWRGMNAIPWKGPPPISAKGFASILAGSAANPSLNPSMPSEYNTRNYFMISKSFCNAHLRFGYHFSTIEALTGDNPTENYIRFKFKGGAADHKRRVARARLVSEVLEEKDFRTVINRDSISARIENYDRKYMESRLEILGHVVIHTRQLDMAMNSQPVINKYKQNILDEIERF